MFVRKLWLQKRRQEASQSAPGEGQHHPENVSQLPKADRWEGSTVPGDQDGEAGVDFMSRGS